MHQHLQLSPLSTFFLDCLVAINSFFLHYLHSVSHLIFASRYVHNTNCSCHVLLAKLVCRENLVRICKLCSVISASTCTQFTFLMVISGRPFKSILLSTLLSSSVLPVLFLSQSCLRPQLFKISLVFLRSCNFLLQLST